MKIFCLGLSRTGTHSLSTALERLGFTSKHYPFKVMQAAEEYDALSDIPVIPYMRELDKKYPDAKFILTVRDINDWIKSVKLHWSLVKAGSKTVKENRIKVYGRIDFNEQSFRQTYKTHCKKVKEYCDPLLIMNVCKGDGYEKLCPFLNLPVLQEPFPKESVRRPT